MLKKPREKIYHKFKWSSFILTKKLNTFDNTLNAQRYKKPNSPSTRLFYFFGDLPAKYFITQVLLIASIE